MRFPYEKFVDLDSDELLAAMAYAFGATAQKHGDDAAADLADWFERGVAVNATMKRVAHV